MPANVRCPVPMDAERHLDLQADLHFFFDTLVSGKSVLDVGAGLGKSKARIRHNRVTTYEPSEHCRAYVDVCGPDMPVGPFDVVTAFEVLEHVENDAAFLRALDARATQAVFLTTPNWEITRCRSNHHWREYMRSELDALIGCIWPLGAWPKWVLNTHFGYFKDAEGGWCEALTGYESARQPLKYVVLVDKGLSYDERQRIYRMFAGRARQAEQEHAQERDFDGQGFTR